MPEGLVHISTSSQSRINRKTYKVLKPYNNMKNEEQLREQYPKAYTDVMNNPIRHLWDNMEYDRKLEILKGITENLEDTK